jgi:hypothetical protein
LRMGLTTHAAVLTTKLMVGILSVLAHSPTQPVQRQCNPREAVQAEWFPTHRAAASSSGVPTLPPTVPLTPLRLLTTK